MKTQTKPGFKSTRGKGFHMTFDNGCTISVQFGPGNYCDNYDLSFDAPRQMIDGDLFLESKDAEIGIWDKLGHWITKEFFPENGGDDVVGRLSANEVADLIAKVVARE